MAKVLTLLFEITGLFDMKTRTELVMLQKTMVVVEGVGRMLDPQLDMWRTAEPVVRDWIGRNLGPVGRIEEAGRGAMSMAGAIAALPENLARGERLLAHLEEATRRGFALDEASISALAQGEARRGRATAFALWSLVILAVWALFIG